MDHQAFDEERVCPPYTCELPKKVVKEDKCSMTGSLFHTFDGTDFNYDICNHVLARDKTADKWSVTGTWLETIEIHCSIQGH